MISSVYNIVKRLGRHASQDVLKFEDLEIGQFYSLASQYNDPNATLFQKMSDTQFMGHYDDYTQTPAVRDTGDPTVKVHLCTVIMQWRGV